MASSSKTLAPIALCLMSMAGPAAATTQVLIRDCDQSSNSSWTFDINKNLSDPLTTDEIDLLACNIQSGRIIEDDDGEEYAVFECLDDDEVTLQLTASSFNRGVAGKSSVGLKHGNPSQRQEMPFGTCGDGSPVEVKFETDGVQFKLPSIGPVIDAVCNPNAITNSTQCVFANDAKIEGMSRIDEGTVVRFEAKYYDEHDEVAMCAYVELCRGRLGDCRPAFWDDEN